MTLSFIINAEIVMSFVEDALLICHLICAEFRTLIVANTQV